MEKEKHLSTTTISSDTTVPISDSSSDASASTPPPRYRLVLGRLRRLRFLFLRHLHRLALSTDRTLVRLAQLLSTPAGIDAFLCTIGYALELLSALASKSLETRLKHIATDIVEKANGLLPGEALIATLPTSTTTQLLAQTAESSKALATILSDYRIFVRLWGLFGIYTWTRSTVLSSHPPITSRKDKVLRGVLWSQIVSGWAFQILENGAYLASKGVLTGRGWAGEEGKRRETRWWVWSSRFWSAHVVLEGVRLLVLRSHENHVSHAEKEKDEEEKLIKERSQREDREWWRDVVSNVAYFPMTLHWSIEEGLLSDAGVGICGMFAGGALLVDAWKDTA